MNNTFLPYDSAIMYSNAFIILYGIHLKAREDGDYAGFGLIIPAMTNGAFACELFLKALLNTPVRGHRLYKDLLSKLEEPIRKEIENVVIKYFKERKEEVITQDDYFLNLNQIEKTFEELRYFYEPKGSNENKYYNIDFMEALVFSLKTICEQKFGPRPQGKLEK